MRRRVAVAVALAVGTSGCLWEAPGNGPHRNAFNPTERIITADTVSRLGELWTVTTDGAARFPIVSDEAVHVVDDGHLYGIEKATGEVLWQFDVPTGTTPGPAADQGDPGLVIGVGPWGAATPPAYETYHVEPAIGAVTDPRKANGWYVGAERHSYLVERLSRPVPDDSAPLELYYEHVDYLQASRSWSRRIAVQQAGSQLPPSPSIGLFVYQAGFGPLVDSTGRYLGSTNALRGYLTTAPPTGECSRPPVPVACPAWSTIPLDGTTATSPVLAERGARVFTGTDAGVVYAISGAPLGGSPTGTILWRTSVGEAVTQSPARGYGILYVPTAGGGLVALDEATGAALWTATTPGGAPIDVQPALGGGLVYVAAADGTVHAFDADGCGGATTCTALWSVDTGDAAITGAPALSQGRLFVGTADGRLIAFGPPA